MLLDEAKKILVEENIRRAKELLGGAIQLNQDLTDHRNAMDIAADRIQMELCDLAGKILGWQENEIGAAMDHARVCSRVELFKSRRANESL